MWDQTDFTKSSSQTPLTPSILLFRSVPFESNQRRKLSTAHQNHFIARTKNKQKQNKNKQKKCVTRCCWCAHRKRKRGKKTKDKRWSLVFCCCCSRRRYHKKTKSLSSFVLINKSCKRRSHAWWRFHAAAAAAAAACHRVICWPISFNNWWRRWWYEPPPPSLGRDVFAVFDRSADDAYSAAWANSDCKSSIIDPLVIRLANYERKNERRNERVGVKLRSHHLGMHLQRNG